MPDSGPSTVPEPSPSQKAIATPSAFFRPQSTRASSSITPVLGQGGTNPRASSAGGRGKASFSPRRPPTGGQDTFVTWRAPAK